jgi:hypothetical protein
VAAPTSTERGGLGLNRLMPMASTPVGEGLRGPSQARPPRLAPQPPVLWAGTRPRERASQTGQGGRPWPALLGLRRTPTGPPPRLVRGQGPSAAPQPLAQPRPPSRRLVLPRNAKDAVVPLAHQGGVALQPWLPLGCTPQVEPVGQRPGPPQR